MSLLAAFQAAGNATAAAAPAAAAAANGLAAAAAGGGGGLASIVIGWQGIVVCITLAVALLIMGFDAAGPDLVFGGLAAIYMASGIITTREGAAGFSNTGVLTVLALFVVAEGVSQTGGLDILMNKVLGSASSVFWAQVRMMLPVMVSSAFLNNTPIVALLIPILMSWSRRCNVPVKKLLIPLSFATVLGGTATLIGTSTNLVVAGLQEELAKSDPTVPVFRFFTITPYGLPYALWGMAYILLFSWLLPGHEGAGHTDLTSELAVSPKAAKVAGAPIGKSGLLAPVGTARIIAVRTAAGTAVAPLSPELVVATGDVVIVQGTAGDNAKFASAHGLDVVAFGGSGTRRCTETDAGELERGPTPVCDPDAPKSVAQVTVAPGADVIGKTVRETGFRGRFDAAIIAVKRNNLQQGGRLGDIELRKGDVLVVSLGEGFDATSPDFKRNLRKLKYLDQALQREYTTAMRVSSSKLAGKTINQAGLRGVTGLFLYEIHRKDGAVLRAVAPDTELMLDDTLFFAGDLASVTFLMKFEGLEHQQQGQITKLATHQVDRNLVQAVVSPHSPLAHRTAREARFRSSYGAALLSVHRAGQSLTGDVANIKLQSGDVLVLEAGPEFQELFAHNPAFALISTVPNSAPVKRNRMWLALAIVGALIVVQIIEGATGRDLVHLWPASVLAAALMLLTRCMNAQQARASMDWEIYICIAFAFGVSGAMEKTNVAQAIAELFAALSRRIGGQTAALTSMYLVTALLSELLTNNASAAIMFPIAASLSKQLGVPMDMMSIAIMLGGSAGWILPYSYQCNLMVMAAGGYRTVDFVKFGAPLHPWLLVGVVLILGAGDRVYIPLIASAVFVAAIIILPLIYEYALTPRQRAALAARAPWARRGRRGDGTTHARVVFENGGEGKLRDNELRDQGAGGAGGSAGTQRAPARRALA